MDTRDWIVQLINKGDARRYGPRGGQKSLDLPFDGSQIQSADIQGQWCNDSTGGLAVFVELIGGDSIMVDGEYHPGSDDTLAIPL